MKTRAAVLWEHYLQEWHDRRYWTGSGRPARGHHGPFNLALFNKEIKGTIFGSGSPRAEIPRLLRQYQQGQLKLHELITKTYTLDEINDGYQDMRDGKNIRGVIAFG